jgi:hypothetical protein
MEDGSGQILRKVKRKIYLKEGSLKGQCHEIFRFRFYHESSYPKPLKMTLGHFELFRKFAEIFASQGALQISTTPVENLAVVSTTPVANLPAEFFILEWGVGMVIKLIIPSECLKKIFHTGMVIILSVNTNLYIFLTLTLPSIGLFSFEALSLISVAQSNVACGLTHPFYVSYL